MARHDVVDVAAAGYEAVLPSDAAAADAENESMSWRRCGVGSIISAALALALPGGVAVN